jgi:hypothetical protein
LSLWPGKKFLLQHPIQPKFGKNKSIQNLYTCNIHAFHETQKNLFFPELASFAKPGSNMQ